MAYIDIPLNKLATIAEKIIDAPPSLYSNEDFAVGHLLSHLTKDATQLEAARGLLIFALDNNMTNLLFIINQQEIDLENVRSDQRLIHLTALYHYMKSQYEPDAVPDYNWVIQDYKKNLEKVLRRFILSDLHFNHVRSAIGTLEVLRDFYEKLPAKYLAETKDPDNADRQLMVRFIKFIHEKCMNHESEIQIRLGLLLFIVMDIAAEYQRLYIGLISPTRSTLYGLIISFLKVKHHSQLTLDNRSDLLETLAEFLEQSDLPNEFKVLNKKLVGFCDELSPEGLDESAEDVLEYKVCKKTISLSFMLFGAGKALCWAGGAAGAVAPLASMTLYLYSHDTSQVGTKLYDLMNFSDDMMSRITLGLYSHLFSKIFMATTGVRVVEVSKPKEGYETLYAFVPDQDKQRIDDWIEALLSLPVPAVITEKEKQCICAVLGRPNLALEKLPELEVVDEGEDGEYLLMPSPPSRRR